VQCTLALQGPLQTPIALGVFRNCRAETVPAHKTPLTSAARNAVLIIFVPMIVSFMTLHRGKPTAAILPSVGVAPGP
jgi:hypothetical protein